MKLNKVCCKDGGILWELYKDPAWGQLTLRTLPPGARNAGHRHPRTDETWVLARGSGLWVTLEQEHCGSWEFRLPTWHPLRVEPGVGHAVENRGEDEAVLLFWADRPYDPDDPDKEPWNETD